MAVRPDRGVHRLAGHAAQPRAGRLGEHEAAGVDEHEAVVGVERGDVREARHEVAARGDRLGEEPRRHRLRLIDRDRSRQELLGELAQCSHARMLPRHQPASRSANTKPSRSTTSPSVTSIACVNIGPRVTNVWNSPFSPHGSTLGGQLGEQRARRTRARRTAGRAARIDAGQPAAARRRSSRARARACRAATAGTPARGRAARAGASRYARMSARNRSPNATCVMPSCALRAAPGRSLPRRPRSGTATGSRRRSAASPRPRPAREQLRAHRVHRDALERLGHRREQADDVDLAGAAELVQRQCAVLPARPRQQCLRPHARTLPGWRAPKSWRERRTTRDLVRDAGTALAAATRMRVFTAAVSVVLAAGCTSGGTTTIQTSNGHDQAGVDGGGAAVAAETAALHAARSSRRSCLPRCSTDRQPPTSMC